MDPFSKGGKHIPFFKGCDMSAPFAERGHKVALYRPLLNAWPCLLFDLRKVEPCQTLTDDAVLSALKFPALAKGACGGFTTGAKVLRHIAPGTFHELANDPMPVGYILTHKNVNQLSPQHHPLARNPVHEILAGLASAPCYH